MFSGVIGHHVRKPLRGPKTEGVCGYIEHIQDFQHPCFHRVYTCTSKNMHVSKEIFSVFIKGMILFRMRDPINLFKSKV